MTREITTPAAAPSWADRDSVVGSFAARRSAVSLVGWLKPERTRFSARLSPCATGLGLFAGFGRCLAGNGGFCQVGEIWVRCWCWAEMGSGCGRRLWRWVGDAAQPVAGALGSVGGLCMLSDGRRKSRGPQKRGPRYGCLLHRPWAERRRGSTLASVPVGCGCRHGVTMQGQARVLVTTGSSLVGECNPDGRGLAGGRGAKWLILPSRLLFGGMRDWRSGWLVDSWGGCSRRHEGPPSSPRRRNGFGWQSVREK